MCVFSLAVNIDLAINIVANLDQANSEPKFCAYIDLHLFVPSVSPIATCLRGVWVAAAAVFVLIPSFLFFPLYTGNVIFNLCFMVALVI